LRSSNTIVLTIFSNVSLLSLPSSKDRSIDTIPPMNSSSSSVLSSSPSCLGLANSRC
jgi:hypothetical protein